MISVCFFLNRANVETYERFLWHSDCSHLPNNTMELGLSQIIWFAE